MTVLLKAWSLYVRMTARWPAPHAFVPFIPLITLWAVVAQAEIFPRAFFPGPMEVVQAFASLVYKGILPDYLEDSVARLVVGSAAGIARKGRGRVRVGRLGHGYSTTSLG